MSIDKILRIEDLQSLSIDVLLEAYRNGYKLETLSPIANDIVDTRSININKLKEVNVKVLEETVIPKCSSCENKNSSLLWRPLSDGKLNEIKKLINNNFGGKYNEW